MVEDLPLVLGPLLWDGDDWIDWVFLLLNVDSSNPEVDMGSPSNDSLYAMNQ